MNEIKTIIEEDIYLKDYIYKTYSKKFYGFLKSNNSLILINNNIVSINTHLKKNDELIIKYENKIKETLKIDKEIDILFEDGELIILDKPHDLLTIPSINEVDSLYSRLLFHRSNDSLNVITRLDKQTAGIVVVAKKHYLTKEISDNILLKQYTAQTDNLLPYEEDIINLPILKSNTSKRIIHKEGKESITHYKLLNKEKRIYSLILTTGRTHQIRVHLSHYNASIKGDTLYNGSCNDKLELVCSKVVLIHPSTKEKIEVNTRRDLFGKENC